MAGASQQPPDQREQARQRFLARPMSPEEARDVEAAYRDCLAKDKEEAAYRAALVAIGPEPPIGVGGTVCKTGEEAMQASHMQLNAQRAAAFMSAERACADAVVEAEAVNARRALESATRAARRKRAREAKADAATAVDEGSVID